MRGDFDGSDQRFKDAADAHGKGKVDRRNLAEMYHKAVKKLNVRENITCRKHVANMSLADPPVPPLQGKRPVSAPLQAGTMGRKSPEESTASSALSTSSKKPPPLDCQEARLPQAQPKGDGLPQPGRQGEG